MQKMFSTANWPFAIKFGLPCFMALLLVVVVEFVAISSLDSVRGSLHDVVERKYSASIQLERTIDSLRAVNGQLYLIQVKRAAEIPQDVRRETARMDATLNQISDNLLRFKKEYSNVDEQNKIDEILANVKSYKKAIDFVGSMLDLDFKATVNFVLPLHDAYESMIGNLSILSANFLSLSLQDAYDADRMANIRTTFIYVFNALILMLTIAIMVPVVFSTARSIKSLAIVTEQLADGDTMLDIESLARGDELGRLVRALKVFRDNIVRVRSLRKVSMLYASMNAMMDSLEQGLCSFGPDGICSDIYSKACLTLLEMEPVGKHIADVLHVSAEKKELIDDLLPLLFNADQTMALSYNEFLDMLPKFAHHSKDLSEREEDCSISLDYQPIMNSTGGLQSVLVVATNHSEQLAASRANKEREQKVLMMFRILANRNSFIRFLKAITAYFAMPERAFAAIGMEQMKRDVHTYKGEVGFYGLHDVAGALNDAENLIAEATVFDAVAPQLMKQFGDIRRHLADTRKDVAQILGDDFDSYGLVRTLPLAALRSFADRIRQATTIGSIYTQFLRDIMGEPIRALLQGIDIELRDLADRYGKKIGSTRFEGEDFKIMPEIYAPLLASFTHIARNIISHAIDDPMERQELGKPLECTLTIITEPYRKDGQDWFRLVFEDDGRGIDPARLRAKLAATHGEFIIAAENDEQILQHIFDSDVSTAQETTELSGRGIGLNVVKYEAEKLGGTAHVESVKNAWTRIVVNLPFLWESKSDA